jgi:hypothetical protein
MNGADDHPCGCRGGTETVIVEMDWISVEVLEERKEG